MSAGAGETLVFCLGAGAALGCLFLLFRGIGLALGLGKAGQAVLDALFCCLCGGAVFLCALAVDRGRPRLAQMVLQGLGAWAAVAALGPWALGLAGRLGRLRCRAGAFFRRQRAKAGAVFREKRRERREKREKSRKKRKKAQKRA